MSDNDNPDTVRDNTPSENRNISNASFSRVIFPYVYPHKKKIVVSMILIVIGIIILPASISNSLTQCIPKMPEIIANMLPLYSDNSTIFMMFNDSKEVNEK